MISCPTCGAQSTGELVCHYCGHLLADPAALDARRETAALDELHRAIATTNEIDERVQLLEGGFLPQTTTGLLDAGARCVALLNPEALTSDAVVSRSRAIVSRLRAQPDAADVANGIAELERQLALFKREDALAQKEGGRACLIILVVLVAVIAVAVWLIKL